MEENSCEHRNRGTDILGSCRMRTCSILQARRQPFHESYSVPVHQYYYRTGTLLFSLYIIIAIRNRRGGQQEVKNHGSGRWVVVTASAS